MGYHKYFDMETRRKRSQLYCQNDPAAYRLSLGDIDRKRICSILRRARYHGWMMTLGNLGDSLWVEAYRSDPAEPKRLQRLGPWPIPADAGQDQVFALVLDAVASVEGEAARGEVNFLPAKS